MGPLSLAKTSWIWTRLCFIQFVFAGEATRQQLGFAIREPVLGRRALTLTWANSRQPDFAAYGFMDYLLVLLWIRG
jgi:hypothetical protein